MFRSVSNAPRWIPVVFAVVVLATLASAPAVPAAGSLYPVFEVSADDQALGQLDDLSFNTFDLEAAGETASMTITTPAAFGISVVRAPGTTLGTAQVGTRPAGGGALVESDGSLVAMNPVAYANDVNAQACAPGRHTAVWSLNVGDHGSRFVIPIAVDRAGTSYTLTQCFGAVKAQGREMAFSDFDVPNIRNPARHGVFLFSGAVTPFAADGTPDPGSVYELRAYEALPENLNALAVYSAATKSLAVTGSATAVSSPVGNTDVQILASVSGKDGTWKDIGYTVTDREGGYSYLRKFARLSYRFAYARIDNSNEATCTAGSAAPGGCASSSVDGSATYSVKIERGLLIKLKSTESSSTTHDALPKGPSKGDRMTARSSLANLGRQFGRASGATVGSDFGAFTVTSAKTVVGHGTATLPGGTIRFSGTAEPVQGGYSFPIVGGTGAFSGAAGTLVIGAGRNPVNTYQLALP